MKKSTKITERRLESAFLSLKNHEECRRFLSDLLTPNELSQAVQRMEVARLLSSGYIYNEIVKQTGASTATVSRVQKTLSYGSGGYDMVLNRIIK